jgi:hypothetical protein
VRAAEVQVRSGRGGSRFLCSQGRVPHQKSLGAAPLMLVSVRLGLLSLSSLMMLASYASRLVLTEYG